jgi:hypothetical protein
VPDVLRLPEIDDVLGDVGGVVGDAFEALGGDHPVQTAAVEQALGYFVRNVSRMQCGTFRAAGWFIGSGVVEVGCKTVIGGRCKQSGMFWSKSGTENILALRCIHSSRRLEDFWKYRLNQHAARNDNMPLAAQRKNFVSHPTTRQLQDFILIRLGACDLIQSAHGTR